MRSSVKRFMATVPPLDKSLAKIETTVDRLIEALRAERAKMQLMLHTLGERDRCGACGHEVVALRNRKSEDIWFEPDGSEHLRSLCVANSTKEKNHRAK